MSHIQKLKDKGLPINAPKFVYDNTHYEVIMGSVAYAVSNDTSDMDIYGFCIPHKEDIFPHLKGEILNFGTQKQRFEQYQQHHVKDSDSSKEYDITIYNIVKYFSLVMENNPNMIDSLFVTQRCILSCTPVAQLIRDKKDLFLHKGCFHKFRGYSYSQMHKMKSKEFAQSPKRKTEVEQYGYSLKFGYHVVRLLNECEQILEDGTLDLERSKEQLKSIRRGEWKIEDIENYFTEKEKYLTKLYEESKLRYSPDEEQIKQLLLNCLEMHYGSLEKAIYNPDKYKIAFENIRKIIEGVST
jgi:predicted nucleotidyltransferase